MTLNRNNAYIPHPQLSSARDGLTLQTEALGFYTTCTIYACPRSEARMLVTILHNDFGFLLVEEVLRGTIVLGSSFDQELRLDMAGELAATLVKRCPGVAFKISQYPLYEYDGWMIVKTPQNRREMFAKMDRPPLSG